MPWPGWRARGEIDLSVLAALTFEKPPRPSAESGDPLTAIHRRLNEHYTGFSYLEECVAAAREGRPAPAHCTYYSYYYLPGLGRRVPGIQTDFLGVNFRDVNEAAADRGLNMVVMKASRRGNVFNCGTNVDVMLRAIRDVKKNGGVVMLLENENMPYAPGNADIPESLVDCVVRSDEPLFIMPHQPLTVLEHAIGSYVADIVDDGATLQIGIGQMADAVAYWLVKKGRTGLSGYSELVSPAFHYLVREGVITRRGPNGALITGAFAVGGGDLYRFMDGNPDVWMTEVHETNNRDHIALLPKFHGINSTLQMDLFSQASSEGFFSDGRYVQYTGMGGQFEFQESAMKSPGGKSILCLQELLAGRFGRAALEQHPAGPQERGGGAAEQDGLRGDGVRMALSPVRVDRGPRQGHDRAGRFAVPGGFTERRARDGAGRERLRDPCGVPE